MRPTIDTTRYQNSHGRQPRGNGYWLFEDTAGAIRHSFNGPYAAARASARKAAGEAGITRLYTCP